MPRACRTLAAALLLAGCASLPAGPGGLAVSVEPEVVHPGDVVTLRATAPAGTRDVRGRLDVPGSPVLPLRAEDDGRSWSFTTQIPLDAVWEPGRYRAVVEGVGPNGERVFGETWITAP